VRVIEFNGGALREVASFYAYDPAFVGGVSVASGDVTGDGISEVITGAGAGGGPHVRVIDLSGGSPTEIASFYAYDPAFIGGVRVASAATPVGGVALAVASGSGGRALNGHDVSMVLARINDSLAYGPAGPSPAEDVGVPDVFGQIRHERPFSLRALGPVDQGLATLDVWRFLRHFPSSELAVAMMAPRCGERR
jgi:hypothetical protein